MLGKTEWPPQGDMRRPKERGIVIQFSGNKYWVMGWRIDPGASALSRPSTHTAIVIPKQDMTPKMDVNDSSRRGKKLSGTRSAPQQIFHVRTPYPATNAFMLSAKSTTRATHAARSSREKRMLTAIRALLPKET